MKYVVTLLLLASFVSAESKDMADYPITFHINSSNLSRNCVMGVSADNKSYIVSTTYGCFHAGVVVHGHFKHNGTVIVFAWVNKKGKVELRGVTVESESAY
jgi:hypothetical protein